MNVNVNVALNEAVTVIANVHSSKPYVDISLAVVMAKLVAPVCVLALMLMLTLMPMAMAKAMLLVTPLGMVKVMLVTGSAYFQIGDWSYHRLSKGLRMVQQLQQQQWLHQHQQMQP